MTPSEIQPGIEDTVRSFALSQHPFCFTPQFLIPPSLSACLATRAASPWSFLSSLVSFVSLSKAPDLEARVTFNAADQFRQTSLCLVMQVRQTQMWPSCCKVHVLLHFSQRLCPAQLKPPIRKSPRQSLPWSTPPVYHRRVLLPCTVTEDCSGRPWPRSFHFSSTYSSATWIVPFEDREPPRGILSAFSYSDQASEPDNF